MKKPLVAVIVVLVAAFGLALSAGAGAGCCAIRTSSGTATERAVIVTLHIEGMTCGSCATAVKRVLKNVEGVKDAQVSFEEKSASVTYDAARVSPERIARAVEEKLATYKATVVK